MTIRKPPNPPSFDKTAPDRGRCQWCQLPLPKKKDGALNRLNRWHQHCRVEREIVFNTAQARRAVFERDKGICAETGEFDRLWELDHKIPLWKVEHLPDKKRYWYFTMENMQTLSPEAHARKTASEAGERAKFKRLQQPKRTKRQKRLDNLARYRAMP